MCFSSKAVLARGGGGGVAFSLVGTEEGILDLCRDSSFLSCLHLKTSLAEYAKAPRRQAETPTVKRVIPTSATYLDLQATRGLPISAWTGWLT